MSRPARPATVLADTVEFVRADIVAAQLAGILIRPASTPSSTWPSSPPPIRRAAAPAMKEQNVIGTMQLLAACQQAPELRKVVVRSSTAAYGASFRDPAVFTEVDRAPGTAARRVRPGRARHRGRTSACFRRRRPDVAATVLRFAPFIGRRADTTLTRYFSLPVVPTVLGRDPRLQFVHVDDAMEILHRAVPEDHPGTFNVAGAGTDHAVPGGPPGRPDRAAGARDRDVGWPPGSPAAAASWTSTSTSSTCSCTAGWSTTPS